MRMVLVAALLAASAQPAAAQQFFPRFDFHLDAAFLASADERFTWDADLGGEVDVVDWGSGRATFITNYEVIMGDEFRRFDPNQGNYLLEGAASARVGGVEAALVFHHISRHLSDRFKRGPIDWNMLGGRVRADATLGRLEIDGRVDLRRTIRRSYVDYTWELAWGGDVRYHLRPRLALISAAAAQVFGVDGSRDRGTQVGARGEVGVRLEGNGAAVEFFLAAERRVDPFPLEFGAGSWLTTGFRLRTR